MPTATSVLTAAQVADYARRGGFPESQIAIAVAVAKAESGWNPRAHNSTPPDDSYGLWQINMLGSLGAPRRAQFGISSNSELFDPSINARAAYLVWKNAGGSWRPWTTFTSGRYQQYMSTAPGVGSGGLDPVETKRKIEEAAENTWKEIDPTGLGRKFTEFTEVFRRQSWNWLIILLGIVLIILGFVILNRARLKKVGKVALDVVGAVK